MLESVLALYGGRLVNSHVEVEREFREGVAGICFEGELRQALNNLVGNAVDAMRGGGRLRVRVRCATDFATGRGGVRLTVADTGTGMSPATQARAFEPFFTTKGILGTGLGLWITRELVAKAQGRLRMRSREEQSVTAAGSAHGTVFALFLPECSPVEL